MRAVRTFTVRPSLPEELEELRSLALNLRWAWDRRAQAIFESIDPELWQSCVRDPHRLLASVGRDRLAALAADGEFRARLATASADLAQYLSASPSGGTPVRSVAYFSPEFGIAEALPQYSGGLGVLAGDHLKAASDLNLPLVGIGLLYRYGYFRQTLDSGGWQDQQYPHLEPHGRALTLMEGARVEIEMGERDLVAQIWRADVGRVRLYLLDADVEGNSPEDRLIADKLYGGGPEHRIRQEVLLGMGGLRALSVVGEPLQVLHTNEGHAGFLTLERVRQLVTSERLSFDEAVEATRAATIFTTHTPVPAGIDRFGRDLMERYLGRWARDCGVGIEDLMALGHEDHEGPEDKFNMAVLGLRMSGRANAVSRLHAKVTREMFASLWRGLNADEVPVRPVTNGVHGPSWVSPEIADLFEPTVGEGWASAAQDSWARVSTIDDAALWSARRAGRGRLVEMVKRCSPSRATLDPEALTVGFARRFAPYKRATLLLSQPERLRALLTDDHRPMQMVFAGKAHPADDAGKEMIRDIVAFSRDPAIRNRFVFVEDYDIGIARCLYQGSDVWLNTPRRPLEACGTSGEKAALNGCLNLSILDGWWDEMYDGTNGWAIESAEFEPDEGRRDTQEANSLFGLLESEVVPLFYERDEPDAAPAGWCSMVKRAWASLGSEVSAARMVRDYESSLYAPTAAGIDALSRDGFQRGRDLSAWRQRVQVAWPGVKVDEVNIEDDPGHEGGEREVQASLWLGDLVPEDVAVQCIHGILGPGDDLAPVTEPVTMNHAGDQGGRLTYRCTIDAGTPGHYGVSVRVIPAHVDLPHPLSMGLATWA